MYVAIVNNIVIQNSSTNIPYQPKHKPQARPSIIREVSMPGALLAKQITDIINEQILPCIYDIGDLASYYGKRIFTIDLV